MPLNPEQTARENLITTLREDARMIQDNGVISGNPAKFATTWEQAANEIEDLAKQRRLPESEAFHEAWVSVRKAMEDLRDMMDDAFKAPEQSMELVMPLQHALWNLLIEWTVLNRAK